MTGHQFLSMAKAIQYLGDATSAQQLLGTLQSTLQSETKQIENAIESKNFELIQKLLHQFKGFAPVFCHDSLIAEIKLTESLCKEIKDSEGSQLALQACGNLLDNLKLLLAEVNAHLSGQA